MRHFIGAPARRCRANPVTKLAFLFCCLVGLLNTDSNAAKPPVVGALAGADFVVGAVHPGLVWPKNLEDPAKRDKLVLWGSWMRHPVEGNVTLGPFKPPAHFSLVVAGMPFDHGNLLLLIRLPDHAVYVVTRETPGMQWKQVDVDLPADWIGHNIELQGVGYQHTPDSWLAFSEPFELAPDGKAVPLWANRTAPLRWHYWGANYFLPITIIFVLFSMIGISGFILIRPYLQTPAYLTPILVAGIVALCGYITFWGFFIRTPVGITTAWIIISASALHLVYRLLTQGFSCLPAADLREGRWPVLILIVAAFFYLGLLNLPRIDGSSMEVLASRRPATWTLPSDNVLQMDIGYFLYHHRDSRSVDTPLWQSSDRPPLECGVQLLSAPVIYGLLNQHWDVNGQLAGMVFQMIWVYGVWATARALGLSTRASGQIALCVIATPFLYINSIFVWSKLSAATFAVGATLILSFRAHRILMMREIVLAGFLIALGMLSHSGIIFYLLPMVAFWIIFPGSTDRPGWRQVVTLGIVAILVFLPWTLYQKLYDPPGDHLLKLHIAGTMDNATHDAFDNTRSLGLAVKVAYRDASWATLWSNRVSNFNSLIKGDWTTLFVPLSHDVSKSREELFLYTFRNCGIYLLGVPAIAVLLLMRRGKMLWPHLYLLSIVLASFLIWCLIMFGPDSTIIHQGAYANQLLLILVCACLLRMVHPRLLAGVCIYNGIQFMWIYADCLPYPPLTDKLAIAIIVTTVLIATLIWIMGGDTISTEVNDGQDRDSRREDLRRPRTAISAVAT